jgi:hypothetical protein
VDSDWLWVWLKVDLDCIFFTKRIYMPKLPNLVHDLSAHCCWCHLCQICCMWTSVIMQDNLWQFCRSPLPNCLVRISAKQVTVILCINCYTMWKEVNMNHSFWIPKRTALIVIPCGRKSIWITPSESRDALPIMLPAESCVFNFLSGGHLMWHHSMLDCFDSSVPMSCHRSLCSRNVFLWLGPVQMFGGHSSILCLLVKH